jgi:hypothetical protein
MEQAHAKCGLQAQSGPQILSKWSAATCKGCKKDKWTVCFLDYKHGRCDTMHLSRVNKILENLLPQSSGYQATKLHGVTSQKTIIL